MRKLILVLGFLFAALPAKANDIYFTQNGTGTGASCSDPQNVTYFNTASNWGSGKPITAGTILHLCGTFTGTAGQQLLAVHGSGTSSAPITIKFESGANLTAPYWSVSGAINESGFSYITIDGGTNGIIQNTANGTGMANQVSSIAINGASCTGCVVQNLTIANLYVHTSTSDVTVDQTSVNCIHFNSATNVTVSNVTCHDAGWAITGPGTGFTVKNSDFYHVDHGIACGASGTISNFSVHDNHFHDFANWDSDPTINKYHHDAVHLWASSPDLVSTGVIYNNLVDGDSGVNVTAYFYLEGNVQNVTIFNNVLLVLSTRTIPAPIYLTANHSGVNQPATDNALYNNFVNAGGHTGGAAVFSRFGESNFTAVNNVLTGGNTDLSFVDGGSLTTTGINNELYDDIKADFGVNNALNWQGTNYSVLSSWQSACHCDAKSLLVPGSQINADSTGHLLAGSKGIGLGANLTSIATGIRAPLARDKNGVARPATGAWDVGAYETQGGTAINFGSGFSATGMAFNGAAALNGTRLRLTNGLQSQIGSGWFTTQVNVQSFTTDFTFQLTNPNADGMTFAIQNSSTGAIASCGAGLGYGSSTCSSQPGIPNSVAVKFDLFQNAQEGNNSTGLYTNGATPTIPATTFGGGVNLHSGNVFKVHMTYDGTTLTMTITDTVTNATFTISWAINIPSTVGANTAYVGFTGSTGGQTATQEIVTWTYSN
jgi:hypothetical protein